MGGFVEDDFVARLSENLKSCQATSGCYNDTNESVSQNVKLLLGEIKTVIVAHKQTTAMQPIPVPQWYKKSCTLTCLSRI